MKCNDDKSLALFINPIQNAPYNYPLLANTAPTTTTTTSIWSDGLSQHSDDTNPSTAASDSDSPTSSNSYDSCDPYCFSNPSNSQSSVSSIESLCEPAVKLVDPWQKQPTSQHTQVELPAELRQNPRRTSSSAVSRTGVAPTLVRQVDRKVNFVDNLVDSSTHIVETIWPTSSIVPRNENGNNTVLPLRTFIQETLRRSRTSYSTLQVALYYLILIKPHVPLCDFTMVQPDDCPTSHALQCGRRMFLAALILASKYLQDRNYSARAWSKISGLNALEINQNEITFLLAVNWKLHITDDIYNRWTEHVMKHTPSQPPSPGGAAMRAYERNCVEFRFVIMCLRPELDNLEEVCPWLNGKDQVATRVLFAAPNERSRPLAYEAEPALTPKYMEPSPTPEFTPGRHLPALGLLPTPRLAPQTGGLSTPAVSAACCLLGKGSSMGFAMAQASYAATANSTARPSPSITSSPQSFTRRSSLANTVSTASSPESMVSDSSRISRSSSISSASSLVSAPAPKLDVQVRCRYAKQCSSERWGLRPTIASVPEDYEVNCLTASPEMYAGALNKDTIDISMQFPSRQFEMEIAARALQELQRYGTNTSPTTALQVKTGSKRSRAGSVSTDDSLQENVREILMSGFQRSEPAWSDTLVRRSLPGTTGQSLQQMSVPAVVRGRNKRVCCSTEAAAGETSMISSLHPARGGLGGPGMWEGILN